MKSRQFIWLLLILFTLNLNSLASTKINDASSEITEAALVSKRVFILIRSAENHIELQKFKVQINENLKRLNVSAQIETYDRSEPLPQAKIFKTAYAGNYDVILLIDQIAKYSIDNRVTNDIIRVGGKYKIRSYNLKETPYVWIDHGETNCNITVSPSIKAFTKKILGTMNMAPGKINELELIATKPAKNDNDIMAELLDQLKEQRKKTRRLLYEIDLLERKLRNEKKLTQIITNLN